MDIRLRRRSVSLIADLAESLQESTSNPKSSLFNNRYFLKSVVDLTASSDFDLQEKVGFFFMHEKTNFL